MICIDSISRPRWADCAPIVVLASHARVLQFVDARADCHTSTFCRKRDGQ